MVSFGEKVKRGLSSPSQNRARLGDAFTVAYGLQGALTSRAGAVARGPEDLSENLRGFYEAYVTNYFGVVAAWYRSVKVGAVAGKVFEAAESAATPGSTASRSTPDTTCISMNGFIRPPREHTRASVGDSRLADGHHPDLARALLLHQCRRRHRARGPDTAGPHRTALSELLAADARP